MSRPARPKPEVAQVVAQQMDQAILELPPLPPLEADLPPIQHIVAPVQPLQEFPRDLAGGYRVVMTYNPNTWMTKLRDGMEVLTVPFQRRREYAAWLREVADRLEAIRPGEKLEETP